MEWMLVSLTKIPTFLLYVIHLLLVATLQLAGIS